MWGRVLAGRDGEDCIGDEEAGDVGAGMEDVEDEGTGKVAAAYVC